MHLDDETLPEYVASRGLPDFVGSLRVEPAGQGNINYVRRVRASSGRSLVVKHARPTLERFPEYAVTPKRLHFEARYQEVVRERAPDVAELLPRILDFDPELPAILMEDLGEAEHLEDALARGATVAAPVRELGHFLARVHAATAPVAGDLAELFANDELRSLHGEHIFTLPFEENDFPIDADVRAFAQARIREGGRRAAIEELRARYYGPGTALVHADVQGTNVLLQERADGLRPRLLDAEIAHVGDPAFDLGVALAHVEVHRVVGTDRNGEPRDALLAGYRAGGGDADVIADAARFAAVELLRRTLGAARLATLDRPPLARKVLAHAFELLG